MSGPDSKRRLAAEDAAELVQLLGEEEREYRRLLRLAWRQNAYLRRLDVPRLERNSAEWQKYLPAAGGARRRREDLVRKLAKKLGISIEGQSPQFLVDHADNKARLEVVGSVSRLVSTTGELCRQNALNRQLADFCLDLAGEEAEIFRRGVLEDPAGCYDGDAARSVAPPGGVIRRKA